MIRGQGKRMGTKIIAEDWERAWKEYLAAEILISQLPQAEDVALPHLQRSCSLAVNLLGEDVSAGSERAAELRARIRARLNRDKEIFDKLRSSGPGDIKNDRVLFEMQEALHGVLLLTRTLLLTEAGWVPFYRRRFFWTTTAVLVLAGVLAFLVRPVPPYRVISSMQGWGSLQYNRSVEGKPLSIGGRKYDSGLGTHAVSNIELLLTKPYRVLSGACGVDDEIGENGSIQCRISANGAVLFRTGTLRGSDPPQQFSVNVEGKERLRLEINDAGDGTPWDHADWVDLRLQ